MCVHLCMSAAGAKLNIAPHKKAILVTGETMKVKETLKALSGSWNKALVGWVFQGSKKEQVRTYMYEYMYRV